jgi:hypothetical protein
MQKEEALSRIKERLEKEQAAYEAAGLPDYVRLNRTRFMSSMRKQQDICRKITALETAAAILEAPLYKVDVARGILLGISDQRPDKDKLWQLASSSSMADRLKACQALFDASLPILKKEIMKHAR